VRTTEKSADFGSPTGNTPRSPEKNFRTMQHRPFQPKTEAMPFAAATTVPIAPR
jgi:hypothetical protein